MISDFDETSKSLGSNEGLLWFPSEVLKSIGWFVGVELESRDRDFAAIESDPRTVW